MKKRIGLALGPGLTSYVAHALASALDFAHTADDDGHAAGIIHRDVSPGPQNAIERPALMLGAGATMRE